MWLWIPAFAGMTMDANLRHQISTMWPPQPTGRLEDGDDEHERWLFSSEIREDVRNPRRRDGAEPLAGRASGARGHAGAGHVVVGRAGTAGPAGVRRRFRE